MFTYFKILLVLLKSNIHTQKSKIVTWRFDYDVLTCNIDRESGTMLNIQLNLSAKVCGKHAHRI